MTSRAPLMVLAVCVSLAAAVLALAPLPLPRGPLIGAVVCAGLAGGVVWRMRQDRDLARAAGALGLRVVEPSRPGIAGPALVLRIPTLQGTFEGREVRVEDASRWGLGRGAMAWEEMRVGLRGGSLAPTRIAKRGPSTAALLATRPTRIGGAEVRTGDPAFDAAFLVESELPEAAQAQLTPELRAAIIALPAFASSTGAELILTVGSAQLFLAARGRWRDEATLRTDLQAMVRVAEALEAARPA